MGTAYGVNRTDRSMKPFGNKRAARRHHKARMKKRAVRIYSQDPISAPENASRWGDHITVCSCYMCGNPRKWFGEKTMQEKRRDK